MSSETGRRFEFRLLGPLEVATDRALLPVGGPRQRALLAFLLLRANQVVRRESLIDALWGERPPARAQNSLQVAVHGLRGLLGPWRIETVADGYRLNVDPGELDVARFHELLERDPGAALELWRGPALAGVEAPFAAVEAARLEELRLGAIEARIATELEGGKHERLVPELEGLIAEHPFRERLRGQLMLALYRAGRQAEALEAYQAARRLLLDELGIEPSPELKQLEQRILRQDPTLSPPRAAPRPAATTSFVGRELELAAVAALLGRTDVRLVTLTGAGGTGKTRLALELAGRLPGGTAFVDLAPLADAGLVPAAIAAMLGVSERTERSVVADLKEQLRDRRLLFILDNFEHLLAAAPLVGELLRAAPELKVLVTSRARLHLSGEHEYVVPPLSEREAVELFVQRARAVDPGFAAGGAAPIAEICNRLDALPLAIELAAARVKLFSAEALLARLESRLPLLAGSVDVPERQRTLRATLDWSYGLLSRGEQRLFGRLGVFAGGFDVAAAEAVCQADLEELAALVDISLVRRAGDRLALLETIREYALERLVESGEEEELRRAHAGYFLSLAEESQAVMYGGDQVGWWDRLERDHDDLRAALAWSARRDVEIELRLAVALWAFWSAHGHLSEGRRWLDGALEHADAGYRELRANAAACAGALAYRQGDWDYTARRFEDAYELYRELGDELGRARMLGELGNLAVATGEYEHALDRYEKCAALLHRLGDERRLAQVIANLGSVASIQRDFERARSQFEDALKLQQALGNREAGAISLHNIGRIELTLDRLDEAAARFADALRDARELGHREVIAYCLEAFGELALARGELKLAARLIGAAGALFDELGLALAPQEAETFERAVAVLREQLGPDGLAAERAAGAAQPLDDAITLALGLAETPLRRP